MEYHKLEKIGYGGVKAKILSDLTDEVYVEFQEQYKVFATSSYNCLDVTDTVWVHCGVDARTVIIMLLYAVDTMDSIEIPDVA